MWGVPLVERPNLNYMLSITCCRSHARSAGCLWRGPRATGASRATRVRPASRSNIATVRESADQRNTATRLAAIRSVYAEYLANGESGAVACFMLMPGYSGNDPGRWLAVRFESGVSPVGEPPSRPSMAGPGRSIRPGRTSVRSAARLSGW